MTIETWRLYAQCWSQTQDERRAALSQHVTDDVRYRDPNTEVAGRDALAAYMAGFQHAFPGHCFEIREVVAHHDRSVAWWRQLDPCGHAVHDGVSFAAHDETGRLRDITGFFGSPSPAEHRP
jgi:predicted ester cyclase